MPAVRSVFKSPFLEFTFFTFVACSLLWYLNPSALAGRAASLLRPVALRNAARGKHRTAAVAFAAANLAEASVTILQAFFAACLVVNAVPKEASLALPAIPKAAAALTGPSVRSAVGFWLAPPMALGAWGSQVLGVLVRGRAPLLLGLFLLPHLANFVLAATAPRARILPATRGTLADAAVEVLRTVVAASLYLAAAACGCRAVGQPLPTDTGLVAAVALAAAGAWSPLVADLATAIRRRPAVGDVVRGHKGGEFLSGRVLRLVGRHAEVSLVGGGIARIGAATAAALVRHDRSGGEATVPASGLRAALAAARKKLTPQKDKKKLLLRVVTLAGVSAALYKWPTLRGAAYAVGVVAYLCKIVVPQPLVLTVAAVTIFSGGPAGSTVSRAALFALALSALPARRKEPGPLVVCTGLDLNKSQAKIVWRAPSPAEGVQEAVQAAVTSADKPKKPSPVKGVVTAVLALACVAACIWFRPLTHYIAAATAKRQGVRLAILGACAGLSVRLMPKRIVVKGAREVLPAWLATALSGPALAVQWFLAVNFRAAAAGAVLAVVLPPLGLRQRLVYRYGLKWQIEWFDQWLYRVSAGFLLIVLAFQAAALAVRVLPARPAGLLALTATCLARGATFAAATAAALSVGLPAAGALPLSDTAVAAAALAAGALGAAPPPLRDWAARVWYVVFGGPREGSGVWTVAKPLAAAVGAPAEGTLVRGQLQRYDGPWALLRVGGTSGFVSRAGAAELWGAGGHGARHIGVRLEVPGGEEAAKEVASAVRHVLRREGDLLRRWPFAPNAAVAKLPGDGAAVDISAFVDRHAISPDHAWAARSRVLEEAARVATEKPLSK